MSDNHTDLHELFKHDELLSMCAELNIGVYSASNTALELVNIIIKDLDDNGVPAEDDCSDLLADFILDAGYEDDDEEVGDDNVEVIEHPHCFGFADKRDPACKRCPLMALCMATRLRARDSELPCYGLEYEPTAPECSSCMERGACRQLVIKLQEVGMG